MNELYQCKNCGDFITEGKNFCSSCGTEKVSGPVNSEKLEVNHIIPAVAYYFIILAISLIYGHSEVFNDSIWDELIVTVLMSAITLGFALFDAPRLYALLKVSHLKVQTVFFTIVICVAGAVVVFFLAEWLNWTLFDTSVYYLDRYRIYTDNPWLYAIVLVCIQPALFEELVFRGFIFNRVSELAGIKGAVITTSFLFAILHLSTIGLFWLLPLGFLLAYFRVKYKTLWYGMIGHFCYNFTIIYLEHLLIY